MSAVLRHACDQFGYQTILQENFHAGVIYRQIPQPGSDKLVHVHQLFLIEGVNWVSMQVAVYQLDELRLQKLSLLFRVVGSVLEDGK